MGEMSQINSYGDCNGEIFQCRDCVKAFTERRRYNQHLKTHTKPFRCEICPKGFALRSDLARHGRTRHRVAQPRHPCPVTGCVFSTTRKDNINQHIRKLHGSKPLPHSAQTTSDEQTASSQHSPVKSTCQSETTSFRSNGLSVDPFPTIFAAASAGNVTLLEQLHQIGTDMHAVADDGCNVLHAAARAGNEQATKYLLEQGVPSDLENKKGRLPVHEAVFSGNLETFQLFLRNESRDLHTRKSLTLVRWSLGSGDHGMIKACIDHYGSHVINDRYYEILHFAARLEDTSAMRFMLSQQDLNLNLRNQRGYTPIRIALSNKNTDIWRLLISHPDTDINKSGCGMTPMEIAIKKDNKEVLKALLADKRIQPAFQRFWMTQELRMCLIFNRYEMGTALIERFWSGEKGATYHLLCASIHGEEEKIVELLSRESVIASTEQKIPSLNPFNWAVAMGHFGVAKLLLENLDIDVNSGKEYAFLPLDVASRNGNREIVQLLLGHASTDCSISRALSRATQSNHIDIVRILLLRSDINTELGYPLFDAIENGNFQIAELLLGDSRIDVNARPSYWMDTPLMCSVRKNDIEMVRLICAHRDSSQVRVNDTRGYRNDTALHIALESNYVKIAEFLRTQGAKTWKDLKESPASSQDNTQMPQIEDAVVQTQDHISRSIDINDPEVFAYGSTFFDEAFVQDGADLEDFLSEMEDSDMQYQFEEKDVFMDDPDSLRY